MGFDLRGEGILRQAQPVDEAGAHRRPVDGRVAGQVRVVVADGAVHLAQQLYAAQALELAFEPCRHVGGTGGLPVRA